jgi:hypothetical protein
MGIFDDFLRLSESANPVIAAGLEGRRLGQEDRRKREQEEEERKALARKRAVELAVENVDLAKKRQELGQPAPPAGLRLPEGYVWNPATKQAERAAGLPAPETKREGNAQIVTEADGTMHVVGAGNRTTPLLGPGGQPLRGRVAAEPREPQGPSPQINWATGQVFDPNTRQITPAPSGFTAPPRQATPDRAAADAAMALSTIRTLVQTPSAAGDVALAYAFMKLLDPGSVVREGELALLQRAQSTQEQIRNFISRKRTGEQFTPELRKQMLDQAEAIAAARGAAAQQGSTSVTPSTDTTTVPPVKETDVRRYYQEQIEALRGPSSSSLPSPAPTSGFRLR